MISRLELSRQTVVFFLSILCVSVTATGQTTAPDFSDVDDILLGQRQLLRNDDLVIAYDRRSDFNDLHNFDNYILETANLRVSKQINSPIIKPNCLLQRTQDTSEKPYVINVYHSRIGRLFDLNRDVTVTLAPAAKSSGVGCPGKVGLYIKDHVDSSNNSLTEVDNSGPFWTQLLLADFDQDGFDDVFQFHSSSLKSGGFALLTAVDVQVPSKGLKRVNFRGMPADFVPVTGIPVSGDFNGDGAVDIAWLGAKPESNSPLSIYFLSICPKAGVKVLGVTCDRPFSLVPSDSRKISQYAIKTNARLNWPEITCGGCGTSTYRYGLAAGDFDGRLSTTYGKAKDELVFIRSNNSYSAASELLAYRFGDDLKPDGAAKKTDLSNHLGYNPFFVASGAVNQFRSTDYIATVSGWHDKTKLSLIKFDSGLKASVQSMDVLREAFGASGSAGGEPVPTGIAIGRFDPPVTGGTTSDFNSQIAALYQVNDFVNGRKSTVVHIYSVPDGPKAKPKFRHEHKVMNGRYLEGVLAHYAPLQAGDLQGRSLLLGEPDTFQVESHLQPSVILGSPPQHVDYITPVRADQPAVFNFSAVKKGYHSTYTVEATEENQSSSKSTTSSGWSLAEESKLKGKTSFGVVEVEGDIHQSLEYAEKNTVGETFNTFSSKSFNASTATGFGDQIWYSSKRVNVYLYPVIGQYRCPQDKPNCRDDEKVQLTATFSGPDNVTSNISASGRTLEWYQPVHVPGQLLTYPWNKTQLSLQSPELETLGQTDTGSFYTDDSTRTASVSWRGNSSQAKSVGFSSSFSLGGGFSVTAGTPEETYKKAGGVRGSVGFDMSYSSGLETLNTGTHKVGASTGISIKKPDSFPSETAYQFLVQPFIFGAAAPVGQSQNLKPDADILTHGPLRAAFAADPTTNASGSWWSSGDYRRYIDIGFGFPARWQIVAKGTKGLFDNETACLGSECALMDEPDPDDLWNSSFYWLRGFYIRANGSGAQRTAVRVGDTVELSARVYNHSFVPMDRSHRVRVRFYAQQWDSRTNRPVAGTTSFLVGEDALNAIPAFAGSEEPNWNMARADFNTGECPGGCAGKYFVFWTVVWVEDKDGKVVLEELPGHGLNQQLSQSQLKALLKNDSPSMQSALAAGSDSGLMEQVAVSNGENTSFSNNVGYFHQVFYIHNNNEAGVLRSRQATRSPAAAEQGYSQGPVTIKALNINPERAAAGEEIVLSAVLNASAPGNSAVQVMIFTDGQQPDQVILLEHEMIGHIQPDQDYAISVPLRLSSCGSQQIRVQIDGGEPGADDHPSTSREVVIDC